MPIPCSVSMSPGWIKINTGNGRAIEWKRGHMEGSFLINLNTNMGKKYTSKVLQSYIFGSICYSSLASLISIISKPNRSQILPTYSLSFFINSAQEGFGIIRLYLLNSTQGSHRCSSPLPLTAKFFHGSYSI